MTRTRVIYKREKQAASRFAPLALLSTAACSMGDLPVPAAFMALGLILSLRRAMQRELHWRKYWDRTGFEWGEWSHGKCQHRLGMSKARVKEFVQVRNHACCHVVFSCVFYFSVGARHSGTSTTPSAARHDRR